jgi:hypothetical protein
MKYLLLSSFGVVLSRLRIGQFSSGSDSGFGSAVDAIRREISQFSSGSDSGFGSAVDAIRREIKLTLLYRLVRGYSQQSTTLNSV